jgi:hypothetical protein
MQFPPKLLLLSTRLHGVTSWKATFTKQSCENVNWTELGWGKQTSTNRILNLSNFGSHVHYVLAEHDNHPMVRVPKNCTWKDFFVFF